MRFQLFRVEAWGPHGPHLLETLLQMPRAHEATCYGGVFIQYEPSHMLWKIRCDWSLRPSQNLSCIGQSVNPKVEYNGWKRRWERTRLNNLQYFELKLNSQSFCNCAHILELSIKSGNYGARTASFGTIGYQMREMKILQNEITGIQTSFSTNFGGKLSFILSFSFSWRPPLLQHIFSLLLPVQLL
jgi:hypothetical protein